jgi:hypothetical protein
MGRAMNLRVWLLAATAAGSMASVGAAQAQTLTPIASDPAGGTTIAIGINNNGWITGNIAEPDGSSLGFVRDAAGNYTTFSVNGLPSTFGRALDGSNSVIGYATDASGNMATDTQFVRTNGGVVTVLQNPNTASPLHGIAQGVNSSGVIVGDYFTGPGSTPPELGYVLDGSSLTTVDVPGSARTSARDIEDNGTVAGWAIVGGIQEGFIEQGGVYSIFQDPNATSGNTGTLFEGINNSGLVAGMWIDASGDDHAFEFNSVTDVFTEITVAGATDVEAFGVNDAGNVILTTNITGAPNNFIFNASATPEPAAWALMLTGFFGLGGALRRRHGALGV